MHSTQDDALPGSTSLDLRGFFKELEAIVGMGRREFNLHRINSQWSDAQSYPTKLADDYYMPRTFQAGATALRLLDRTFVLKLRIACHDALLTLHRHMWMARDEQWEGFAREAETYWIRKSKIREAELVQDLANQEEELQEVQEALRIILRASASNSIKPSLPPREPGQPTVLPSNTESVRDLRLRMRDMKNAASLSAPSIPTSLPPPRWITLSTTQKQNTLARAVLLLTRQSQALSTLSYIFLTHSSPKAGLRKAFNIWRLYSQHTANKPVHITGRGITLEACALASAILFGIVFRQVQRRRLLQAFKCMYHRDAVESSSRNYSAVSMVMVPPVPKPMETKQRTFRVPPLSEPRSDTRPLTPGRTIVKDILSLNSDRNARRTPQTARSLSPPQFHSRGFVGFNRGSSGDLMQSNKATEPRLVMSPPTPNVFQFSADVQRQKGARVGVLVADDVRRRQQPFRRPQGILIPPPTSAVTKSPPHTFMHTPYVMSWSEVPIRPAALQTQRLLLHGQPAEVQKPRAIPPVRLPMYDWSPQQTPTIRNHVTATWR
eukprot:Gregarina_sp_Poly_1__4488@NODE_2410_length_2169_cov_158_105614_g642_i2_p1_GENE_NODE_2410_length_2169_cov_158_105614_g642_i2NODE_2410_length_2169_cov_158_105614_g642_i2_p1_ORF_typecomplete_len550_score53_08_NODE_2410_length_2169_cov_158_105614_g642_i21711820